MLAGQLAFRLVEAEALARGLEAAADHPGMRPRALHAPAPGRVVVFAAAHLADEREHVPIAVGKIRHQPFAEEIAHFERQPQQHVPGFLDAGDRGGVEDALDVGTPASDSRRSVSSRRSGVAARGSMTRAMRASSVVTDSATFTRLRRAMRARMSMSRCTRADLVTMPTGWPARSSTSRMRRMSS